MSDILATPPSFDETIEGTRLVVWLRPEVGITRIEGHFSDEVAKHLIEQVDGTLARSKRFLGIHDWTETATFDVTVPARLGTWTLSHILRVGRIQIATQHPLMTMAVRTTNLTLKRIELLPSREAFAEAVRSQT